MFVVLAGGAGYLGWQFLKPVPEVGRDLSHVIADARREFSDRVAARYVAPIPVGDLVDRLDDDGFEVHPRERRAVFAKTLNIACSMTLIIGWEEDGGVATRITGRRSVTCL